jgi:hypothetical protein
MFLIIALALSIAFFAIRFHTARAPSDVTVKVSQYMPYHADNPAGVLGAIGD